MISIWKSDTVVQNVAIPLRCFNGVLLTSTSANRPTESLESLKESVKTSRCQLGAPSLQFAYR